MDLFLIKKIISALIMPLSIILILLFIAILFYKSKPQFSFKCLISATALLFLSAFPPFADWVMEPIENNYKPFNARALIQENKTVDYIVVLGCYHSDDPSLPATIQLKPCSLERLVEAVRIYRLFPNATVITSGGAFKKSTSNAQVVKQAAISLGIPAYKIITENFPKDTEEEAELIAPRVIGKNVVLITNADHMPRAINYFQQQGINPIAAPASYWVKHTTTPHNWKYLIPTSNDLEQTTIAWYETLGRIVQWFKSLF